ncbi:hypothetical protein ES703_94542 [subsurface metagenome]
MLLVLIKLNLFSQVIDMPINSNPHIARLAQIIKHHLILTLTVLNQRCHNHDTAIFRKSLNSINNLLHGLHGNLSPALRAMGVTNPGKKQPQVIINFGYRAYCRPWIATGTFLVNGNSWA